MRGGGRRRRLPRPALWRAGAAVRAAAGAGDELSFRRRRPVRAGHRVLRTHRAADRRRAARAAHHRGAGDGARLGPGGAGGGQRRDHDHAVDGGRARTRLPEPVRPADRRRHRDLRRVGGAGAVGRPAGAPAEGTRDAVHRDRRVGAVDLRDGGLPDDRAGARPQPAASRHLPRRHDPRRGAGGGRGLQPVAGNRRCRHAGEAVARGHAAAGDRGGRR